MTILLLHAHAHPTYRIEWRGCSTQCSQAVSFFIFGRSVSSAIPILFRVLLYDAQANSRQFRNLYLFDCILMPINLRDLCPISILYKMGREILRSFIPYRRNPASNQIFIAVLSYSWSKWVTAQLPSMRLDSEPHHNFLIDIISALEVHAIHATQVDRVGQYCAHHPSELLGFLQWLGFCLSCCCSEPHFSSHHSLFRVSRPHFYLVK